MLGGVISDAILRKTGSLTVARKIPIVGGMLLSMSIIACNYVDGQALVVGFMALAFFGKGIGALGWAVVSDTSPKEAGGVSGGLFNTFGNLSGITTPDRDRLHPGSDRLVQRRAGVRRRQRAGGGVRLPRHRRQDRAGGAKRSS